MKNLKIAFFAATLLAGVSTAFAYKGSTVCEGQLYGKIGNTENFAFAGQIATDQTLTNYTAYNSADYQCTDQTRACLYYVEAGVIKQCSEGIFAEK